jgi:hypothetical protein
VADSMLRILYKIITRCIKKVWRLAFIVEVKSRLIINLRHVRQNSS